MPPRRRLAPVAAAAPGSSPGLCTARGRTDPRRDGSRGRDAGGRVLAWRRGSAWRTAGRRSSRRWASTSTDPASSSIAARPPACPACRRACPFRASSTSTTTANGSHSFTRRLMAGRTGLREMPCRPRGSAAKPGDLSSNCYLPAFDWRRTGSPLESAVGVIIGVRSDRRVEAHRPTPSATRAPPSDPQVSREVRTSRRPHPRTPRWPRTGAKLDQFQFRRGRGVEVHVSDP